MSTNPETMTEQELQHANVLTAREIWFIHNSSAHVVRDPQGTFLRDLLSKELSSHIKFVIAQNTLRQVTLGIFYPEQTAAVSAHALRDFLNWKLDSLALAKKSDLLSYWPGKPLGRPTKQSPTQGDITLVGGWEIHADPTQDQSSSMTLVSAFGLNSIAHEYMEIVRALVLQKLEVKL